MATTLRSRLGSRGRAKTPIGTLIAGMVAAGVKFRWSGATLFAHGLERLSDRDAALFWRHQAAVLKRLRGSDDDGAALLDRLEVWIEVVRTREDAARIIAELPASCGLDCETAPLPEYRIERPWLVITKRGELAKHQPDLEGQGRARPAQGARALGPSLQPGARSDLSVRPGPPVDRDVSGTGPVQWSQVRRAQRRFRVRDVAGARARHRR